jgi:hypothetical protein
MENVQKPSNSVRFLSFLYRVAQNSVSLKHSLLLTGMIRYKPASQFVERYHSVVSGALNMVISFRINPVNPISNYDTSKVFSIDFTSQLTEFWTSLYFSLLFFTFLNPNVNKYDFII